jgi:hypothetical protein
LFPVLPHDRRGGLQPNANGATLVDEGALGGNPFDDIFGGQNLRHSTALGRAPPARAQFRLIFSGSRAYGFRPVIPDIDIWRAATLMLKRSAEHAHKESAARAEELENEGDHDGAAIWRLITDAVEQLANTTPTGPVH